MMFMITCVVALTQRATADLPGMPDDPGDVEDDDMEELRMNPSEDMSAPTADGLNLSLKELADRYPFIDIAGDTLIMNGADWSSLGQRLKVPDGMGRPFVIVHIGDSHLQPDISTGRVRRLLQARYGDAGRGLVIPYRMASTNQPPDYHITSASNVTCSKLMQRDKTLPSGFTGISVAPVGKHFDFKVSSPQPFEEMVLYYDGAEPVNGRVYESGNETGAFFTVTSPGECTVSLQRPCYEAEIRFDFSPGFVLYGLNLKSDVEGVLYHSIGNNGATFAAYADIGDFGERIASLSPDLVILSLGTNEAYGRMSAEELKQSIQRLTDEISTCSPGVEVLLTTPGETHRRRYAGRRRRRSYSYAVNDKVALMSQAIKEFAAEKHIPVFDFHEIAGGKGSSSEWLNAKLLSRDRIHKTSAGYIAEGELLFNALNRQFNNYENL